MKQLLLLSISLLLLIHGSIVVQAAASNSGYVKTSKQLVAAASNKPAKKPAKKPITQITWKPYSKNVYMPVKFKDGRTGNIRVGLDHPNGTLIGVLFNKPSFGWNFETDEKDGIFNEFGDLDEPNKIQVFLHDFDNDKNPEIIVTVGDGLTLGHVWVFSYTSVSNLSKISPFKLELSQSIQEKIILQGNSLLIPYGSQGLFDEYIYVNGKFAEAVN